MNAAIAARPARPLTESEIIFFEAPHGPNWGQRLTAALQREYGVPVTSFVESSEPVERPACQCGCGDLVQVHIRKRAPNQYLQGHNLHPPQAPQRARRWTAAVKQVVPKPARAPKPQPRPVLQQEPPIHECAACEKPFGPDRPRHWLQTDICDQCAKRKYVEAAV